MLCAMTNHSLSSRRRSSHWAFFRQWLRHPLSIAAISPSSAHLARQMIVELPQGARRIVELGGGTGAITEELLAYGIAPRDLLVLELNDDLCAHLHAEFPDVHVACADARSLVQVAQRCGFGEAGSADAVISSLGLLSMGRAMQEAILGAAFSMLGAHGRLIQFTYGPSGPVSDDVLVQLGLRARRARMAWLNLPPATVYVYTRVGLGAGAGESTSP